MILRLLLILMILMTPLRPAAAQGGFSLIRDSEIELYLKMWSADVIKNTGLPPGSVNIILVQSDDINAFVAGGPNIFIYTGLLERSETPEEVIGVIAHELGHIVGGHLSRGRAAMENASYETIIGTILGVGAAILSGRGEAAQAVMGAAQNYALSKYLAHSRVQESSADQAALGFLDGAKIDPSGLTSFLKKMQSDELLPASQQSEYYRTHPVTRNRISALESKITELSAKQYKDNTLWADQHARMKAKLMGFIHPQQVAWAYDPAANTIPDTMAYAVAAYRQSNEEQAIEKVRALVGLEPDNPYYHELAGQILASFGHLGDAEESYQKAHKYMPGDGLIAIAYAHILIEREKQGESDAKALQAAIKLLKGAQHSEPRSTRLYRLLATAYGRLKDDSRANLYLAEESYLKRNMSDTGRLAEMAIRGLKEESREWQRAKDLLFYAEQAKLQKKNN
ncbi:MAG: peptidase M48 family protein [Alphaproteobacteria bacterium]|nr:peptidase M48 family protein [Alphaproteobacteria bacterium]